jgi:hypothetical protein
LYDSTSHHTHFTGWMLEEEIVASIWGFYFDKKKILCQIYGVMV